MKCPKCGLFNPDESLKCDCGYDFLKNDYRYATENIFENEIINKSEKN